MKKMTARLLTATMTGMMLMAAPFTVFAEEKAAQPEAETEEMTEISDEEMDALMEDLFAQLQEIGLGDLLTAEPEENNDTLDGITQAFDFVVQFINDSDVRSSTIKYCLDTFAEDMTEEEKQQMADQLANITLEDIENAGNALQEAFTGEELQEFLTEIEEMLNEKKEAAVQEAAVEIEDYLNQLGQMLIDVEVQDIVDFFS